MRKRELAFPPLCLLHSLTALLCPDWKSCRRPGPISPAVVDPMQLKLILYVTQAGGTLTVLSHRFSVQTINKEIHSYVNAKYLFWHLHSGAERSFQCQGHLSMCFRFIFVCITDYWCFLILGRITTVTQQFKMICIWKPAALSCRSRAECRTRELDFKNKGANTRHNVMKM